MYLLQLESWFMQRSNQLVLVDIAQNEVWPWQMAAACPILKSRVGQKGYDLVLNCFLDISSKLASAFVWGKVVSTILLQLSPLTLPWHCFAIGSNSTTSTGEQVEIRLVRLPLHWTSKVWRDTSNALSIALFTRCCWLLRIRNSLQNLLSGGSGSVILSSSFPNYASLSMHG